VFDRWVKFRRAVRGRRKQRALCTHHKDAGTGRQREAIRESGAVTSATPHLIESRGERRFLTAISQLCMAPVGVSAGGGVAPLGRGGLTRIAQNVQLGKEVRNWLWGLTKTGHEVIKGEEMSPLYAYISKLNSVLCKIWSHTADHRSYTGRRRDWPQHCSSRRPDGLSNSAAANRPRGARRVHFPGNKSIKISPACLLVALLVIVAQEAYLFHSCL